MDSTLFKNSEKMCENSECVSKNSGKNVPEMSEFVLLVALAGSGEQRFETKFSSCARTGRNVQLLCLVALA